MTKLKTISLSGNDYAKVAERLKAFREQCPMGKIETEPTFLPDGRVMFKASVVKDKSNENSAEATGHALSTKSGTKDFEKLESIAIGRALATLGYLASGEIASSEEMEEYIAEKNAKHEELIEAIYSCQTVEELKALYEQNKRKGKEIDMIFIERKKELTDNITPQA